MDAASSEEGIGQFETPAPNTRTAAASTIKTATGF
jgi:hypothetical protein